MKIKIINQIEELSASASQWNRVAGDRCFFTWQWCESWYRELASEDDRLHVIVGVDNDGRWEGIAPLMVSGRRLRFLGSGAACSDYTNLITAQSGYNPFAELVAQYLATEFATDGALSQVDVFEIEGCGGNDRDLDYFCELLKINEFTQHETETEGTWKVLLPDSFEQLNATFSKSMRRKTKAARKRLAEPDVEVSFADEDNFDTLWAHFVRLHQKRRNAIGQFGCFADDKFERFLKSAAAGLRSLQRSDLVVIKKSAVPVAAVLLIYCGETCMMYQSGIDPDASSQEPGYQSVLASIEHAIAHEFKYFDFLRGDEPYKARWSTTREAVIRRKFIPPTVSAQLKHGTWVIGRSIKNYVSNFNQPEEN
jgi:CelD/BcsL family acetyltransferase involved in cellulose biosynthesis